MVSGRRESRLGLFEFGVDSPEEPNFLPDVRESSLEQAVAAKVKAGADDVQFPEFLLLEPQVVAYTRFQRILLYLSHCFLLLVKRKIHLLVSTLPCNCGDYKLRQVWETDFLKFEAKAAILLEPLSHGLFNGMPNLHP